MPRRLMQFEASALEAESEIDDILAASRDLIAQVRRKQDNAVLSMSAEGGEEMKQVGEHSRAREQDEARGLQDSSSIPGRLEGTTANCIAAATSGASTNHRGTFISGGSGSSHDSSADVVTNSNTRPAERLPPMNSCRDAGNQRILASTRQNSFTKRRRSSDVHKGRGGHLGGAAASNRLPARSDAQRHEYRGAILDALDRAREAETRLSAQVDAAAAAGDEAEESRLRQQLASLKVESSEAIVHMVVDYSPSLPAPQLPVEMHAQAQAQVQAQAQAQAWAQAQPAAGGGGWSAPALKQRKPKAKQRQQKSKQRAKTKGKMCSETDERGETGHHNGPAAGAAPGSTTEPEYRFDRPDGYAYDPTSAAALHEAVEQSSVPLHEMPAHRPVDEETGFGLDIGMNGILASHVEPMDASFRSLRVYEREHMKNCDYWMPDMGAHGAESRQGSQKARRKVNKQRAKKKGARRRG